MKQVKKMLAILMAVVIITGIAGCKKESSQNDLGGEVNIPLTAVDSVTSVYLTVNGINIPADAEIKILSNQSGLVTYGGTVDLSSVPDITINSLTAMVNSVISYYNPKDVTFSVGVDKKLSYSFKVKITSEGMQNYFVDGKPWTVKYADAQGTEYTVTRDNGDVLKSTVTEKTGLDDWPYGFYNIKTSKLEFNAPAGDPVLSKVTFRINHKFGAVYLKTEAKDGTILELDIFPWYVI